MFKAIGNAVLAAVYAVGLAMGSTAALGQDSKSTLELIQERGVLLAGVRYDYPPNSYMDEQGNLKGYGVEVAREFARRLGVEVKFVQETSQTRIPLLQNGQVDASFGPTTPSKSRDEVVDFSLVWNVEGAVIVVPAGASLEPADYYGTDKTIGATQGAIFIELWKANDENASFKLFPEYPPLLLAVLGGQVDAALLNEVQARDLVSKIGDGQLVVGKPFFQDPSAIMMRENDSDWRDWVNWALQRMAADGTLARIYQETYGLELPIDIWQNGMLQPGVLNIGEQGDPWNE